MAALALLPVLLRVVPERPDPWHAAQTAVAGFVIAVLSLPLGVSTFAMREKLSEVLGTASAPSGAGRVWAILLALWARCFVIGLLGCGLAYGAASPAAAWPFVAGAAALLVLHAPRRGLFMRPPAG